MTIAVVEDDQILRDGLSELFTREGYTVNAAGSLYEAEQITSADLWLVDVMLPDGSGLDFVRRLREKSSVPILILTALDGEDSVIEGLRAGADDYVTKPFRAGERPCKRERGISSG